MSEALEHVSHCDVLITGCMHTTNGSRVLACHIALDDQLSALDLTAISETLTMLGGRMADMAREQARAN